jgi:hypothetical protein
MALHRRFLPLLLIGLPRPAGAAPDGRVRVGEISAVTREAVARFADAARTLAPAADLLLDDLVSTGPAARLVAQLEAAQGRRPGCRTTSGVSAPRRRRATRPGQ